MSEKVSIYLAGSIKKDHEKSANEFFWTDEDMRQIEKALEGFAVSFLNPAFRSDNLSDQRSVFGRDMIQVYCSDVVFVDARDRRGLGVGAEMMWAKFHKIPVLTLAPKDTHYSKSKTTLLGVPVENWVHPFVESLSDAIVENLIDGAAWIKRFMSVSAPEIRGVEYIQSTMQYYRDTQFLSDEPMKALLAANQKLHQRVWELEKQFEASASSR